MSEETKYTSRNTDRSGKSWLPWIAGLAAAGLIFVIIGAVQSSGSDKGLPPNTPIGEVMRGPLKIDVTESGTVRPREQIVVKNELEDPATIISIVPEGKLVKKGELLVELDVTQLENDVVERRIRVQNDEADLIHAQENLKVVENQAEADLSQAQLALKFAKQDLTKYLEGEYPKLLKEANAKITLAEKELSQANQRLDWSKVLYDEKYIAQSELQRDELSAQQANLNLELAKTDLDLLEAFTKQRQIDQLESDAKQAEMALERTKRLASANLAQANANLSARQAELKEETDRLKRLELQLTKAKVHAPIDGMVLYATSVQDRWRRNDEPIEVGAVIDEQDEIIFLPTASNFNVDINVSEVDLNKVQPGLPVTISIDAIAEEDFTGKVHSIAQLPDSESRYLNPNLKLYKTVVEMDPHNAMLRNGMSCMASIQIAQFDDVLYVPLQAVIRHKGQPIIHAVSSEGIASPQPIEIGLSNGQFVIVKSGVEAGQKILLAPPLMDSQKDDRQPEPDPVDELSQATTSQERDSS